MGVASVSAGAAGTRRHAPHLDELTDAEAITVGWAAARAARARTRALGPEAVFSAIVGLGVPHFQQHVFARHPGTPRELDWMASNEWTDAPHGDAAELAELADRCAHTSRYEPGGR